MLFQLRRELSALLFKGSQREPENEPENESENENERLQTVCGDCCSDSYGPCGRLRWVHRLRSDGYRSDRQRGRCQVNYSKVIESERDRGPVWYLLALSPREVEVLRAALSEANAADLTPSKYYAAPTDDELQGLYDRLPPLFSVTA